jgi:hypothetical protein
MGNSQKGQSTIEFVVLAFVLVPLVIIVPLLGKYMDLAQTTTVASRYVAFEGTVHHGSSLANTGSGGGWKTDEQLATEVRRRFYSRNDLGINTNDVAGEFDGDRNPLWVDHRGNHLLPRFNQIAVQAQRNNLNQPFGATFAGVFGLDQNNLYTGNVGVTVANVPAIGLAFDKSKADGSGAKAFDNLNLQINRTTTVLVDPWAATGPEDVKGRIEGAGETVLPTVHLEAFKLALTIPYAFVEILPGGSASLPDIGDVNPDIVPADRVLQPYE